MRWFCWIKLIKTVYRMEISTLRRLGFPLIFLGSFCLLALSVALHRVYRDLLLRQFARFGFCVILKIRGFPFLVLGVSIFAPVSFPTEINLSNINFAFFLSNSNPTVDFSGPPKKSSTYDSSTIGVQYFFWKWCLKALHYAIVYRQKFFDELLLQNGILRSM